MIFRIALDIEIDQEVSDVKGAVAKAVAAQLGGKLLIRDSVLAQDIEARIIDVCAIYGDSTTDRDAEPDPLD